MKKLLFTTFLILTFCAAIAQEITPAPTARLTDKELGLQYLKNSKNLKIAGWSLLGGGLLLYAIGINTMDNNLFSDNANAGVGLALAGTIMSLGSIPCFIGGARNKGRAEILLRNENIMSSYKPGKLKSIPSLTIAFKL